MNDLKVNKIKELRPSWQRGIIKAFKPFGYVALVVVLWVVLGGLEIVDKSSFGAISLIIGVVLFILGIPITLFVQIHTLQGSAHAMLLILLLLVMVNSILWGAVYGCISGHKNNSSKPESKEKD